MIDRALPDLNAWTAHFRDAPIPVLPQTLESLDALRERPDDVSAQMLTDIVSADPLMMVELLRHVSRLRRRVHADPDDAGETETMTAAIVWLGAAPFLRAFAGLSSVEAHLHGHPPALDGLHRVMRRSFRAAHFALGFAVHRNDMDAEVIQQAALLHDFAELLLWCHAPPLALRVQQRLQAEPGLRSATAQREVLNIELADLEQALMRAWRMPRLLIEITDRRHAAHPRARNVQLAIDLARHTQQGWDDPAIPDDLHAIGELLQLNPGAVRGLLRALGHEQAPVSAA